MQKFQIIADPERVDSPDFFLRTMTQLSYEEFPYQEPMFEEVARSHAWIVEGLADVETKVVTEESLAALYDGVPFREVVGATFFLQVGALKNGGIYKESWLDQPNFKEVLEIYPRSNIEKIAARLTTTTQGFRDDFNQHCIGKTSTARFDCNPLVKTPFIDMGCGDPVAPVTRLILKTVTPEGLFYTGLAKYGSDFADDLGQMFEHYIGRQLKLIDGAEVLPEITYNKGGVAKSVDWIVLLPNLTVLVEVKGRRVGVKARTGSPQLVEVLDGTIGRAREQLARTIENIAHGHKEFTHIPADRPILGMVVTAEQFYTGSAYLVENDMVAIRNEVLGDIPVVVASARDVEQLVVRGDDLESFLLDEMKNRGGGAIGFRRLGKWDARSNLILKAAWDSYPWPKSHRGGTASTDRHAENSPQDNRESLSRSDSHA